MEKSEKEVHWIEDLNDKLIPVTAWLKRKGSSKKLEYVGWGSKPLLNFLSAIGKLTDKQLSQLEVTAVINEYIKVHNLLHPEKKKRVICDEWLITLFGRKVVARNKIHELLDVHFSENNDDSEEDEEFFKYSNENVDDFIACKRQRMNKGPRKPKQEIENLNMKNLSAAIIPENIKLIYLKKSLLLDLAKDSESFERKVIGSYVRIKSDPNDFTQKNSHQLLQVTGVKGSGEGVLLQAQNSVEDISIPMLSDSDFYEEESEDLRQRLKAASLPMPTVGELEEKAIMLHEDTTKHWIAKELVVLQKLIDRANEKGWRRELFEHLEKKQQLGSPAEQSKLLLQLPKITAEFKELDPTQNSETENNNKSPKSILGGVKESSTDSEPNPFLLAQNNDTSGPKEIVFKSEITLNIYNYKDGKIDINSGFTSATKKSSQDDIMRTNIQVSMKSSSVLPSPKKSAEAIEDIISHQPPNLNLSLCELDSSRQPAVDERNRQIFTVSSKRGAHMQLAPPRANKVAVPLPMAAPAPQNPATVIPATVIQAEEIAAPVIELSSDDDDNGVAVQPKRQVLTPAVLTAKEDPESLTRHYPAPVLTVKEDPDSLTWHYLDPQGVVQGPFSLGALKRWDDCGYFYAGFRVWKTGQTLGKSVSLSDLLSSVFP